MTHNAAPATPETMYLSGASNPRLRAIAMEAGVGLLIQPGNRYERQVEHFPAFGADNGAFKLGSSHEAFDFDHYAMWLRERVATLAPELLARCRFVNCPDAIDVSTEGAVWGHPETTIKWALEWAPVIRELGLPVGFVAGNGHETMLEEIPWDLVDAIFLGGSDEWKLGEGARIVVAEARRRGLHVHMGRVNSRKRFHYAASIGCNTADGTFLARAGARLGIPRMLRWFEGVPAHPPVEPAPAEELELEATGSVCGRCSHWTEGRRVQVRHADRAAVKACHLEAFAVAA